MSVDEVLYKIGNPLRAIDVCFKIIHATHSKYSLVTETLWLFLQKAIYNINTDWDRNFVSVNNLLSRIEVQ